MHKANCLAPAAVRMVIKYSFWAEVFYSMQVVEDEMIPTAATDGRKFWVNPVWWKTLSLDEAVGVVAHEIGHKIFLHCTRQGSRDAEVWNMACDYAINAILKSNNFVLPKPHLYEAKYEGMTAETIYADLIKQQKAGGKSGAGDAWQKLRDIRQQQGTPEELARAEEEVKALVTRAVANAKARGSLPAGIETGVVDVYKPSTEPWFNRLHRYMQSLSNSEYNWARLNRRTLRTHGVLSPMHLSEALGEVAVFIDTSGSCFDAAQQAGFYGHLNAIMADTRPRRVHVYSFDATVYPVEVIEDGEIGAPKRMKGGGGTAFEPIFDQIDSDGLVPDVVLVLTDMYGSFPATAPDYPVVWCATSDGVAPFGETVRVE